MEIFEVLDLFLLQIDKVTEKQDWIFPLQAGVVYQQMLKVATFFIQKCLHIGRTPEEFDARLFKPLATVSASASTPVIDFASMLSCNMFSQITFSPGRAHLHFATLINLQQVGDLL